MLQNTRDFYDSRLGALDGDIGQVKDFYFDDHTWVVRYLVAETGSEAKERSVLLSPHAFGPFDPEGKKLSVNLTRKQIEESPSIDSHLPISHQHEEEYYRYYGWPAYWQGDQMWGMGASPVITPPPLQPPLASPSRADLHLRSTKAITGYHIQTTDGTIGHVSGLRIDDKNWAICEVTVEAGHWYSGKEIGITPDRIDRISYDDSKVFVNLTKEEIQRTGENGVAPTISLNS